MESVIQQTPKITLTTMTAKVTRLRSFNTPFQIRDQKMAAINHFAQMIIERGVEV